MYLWLSVITVVIFVAIYIARPDLRTPMLWAGTLSLPLFVFKYLIDPQFWPGIFQESFYLIFLLEAAAFGFAFGGLAAVLFEVFFHQKLKTTPHPHRIHLNWLVFGPITFIFLELWGHFSFSFNLAIAFIVQALILVYLRKDLLWDAVVSGIFLGLIYLVIYALYFTVIPGYTTQLWFADASGILVFGVPVEEFLAIFAFGMLWGPLYEGVKGYRLKSESK
jgi:hypothetical protein